MLLLAPALLEQLELIELIELQVGCFAEVSDSLAPLLRRAARCLVEHRVAAVREREHALE